MSVRVVRRRVVMDGEKVKKVSSCLWPTKERVVDDEHNRYPTTTETEISCNNLAFCKPHHMLSTSN